MNEHDTTIAAPLFKIASVWLAVGITSWADAAAFMAAVYTGLLILEWFWKKVWRGIFMRHGWIKTDEKPID